MNKIRLSIILPFYNVEKYIADCLDSLYAQDIPEEEYEIVCIDDCSPDHSKSIVQEYQKNHANLVLIEHDENKCLGGARNTGMKAAKGKYLWFVDSDDMICPVCLKNLVSLCEKDDLDVLMFNFEKINEKNEFINEETVFSDIDVHTGVDYVNEMWGMEFVHHLGFVWRQVYRTDYLKSNSIYFPENVFWEDTAFVPKSLLLASRVRSIKNIFYQYRVNPASVSGTYIKELRAELIFQFAFNAGNDLLKLSDELRTVDTHLSEVIHSKAVWYINQFSNRILKSSKSELKKFFILISENKSFLKSLKAYMDGLNRIFCFNPFGKMLMLFIYNIKNGYNANTSGK